MHGVEVAERSRHQATRSSLLGRAGTLVRTALGDPVERACYGLVGVHLAFWVWAVSRSYFRQDDFVYLYRAHRHGLTAGYLLQDYGGHLMPGQFLVVWLVGRIAPLSWGVAVVFPFLLRAVASVAFVRLLVQLFGRRAGILGPLALFLFCPLVMFPSLWWAAALQTLSMQAALVLALLAHVRYLRTGQLRDGLLGLAAVAGGLFFWEKALLIPVVLAGVEVVTRRAGLPVAPARRGRIWLAHLALAAGYLGLYLPHTAGAGGRAAAGDVVELTRQAVLDGFLPGLLGGPWSDDFPGLTVAPKPAAAAVLMAVLAAVLVVVGSCLARPRAAVPAWLLVGLYLAIDLGLLAGTRLSFVGPVIGRDPRYVADAVVVAAVALGFAVLPLAGGTDPAASAPSRWWPRVVRPETGVAAARSPVALVLLPAYLASCMLSTVLVAQHMKRTSGRDFVLTARQELTRQPAAVVWDGLVPENLIALVFVQDARVSRVLGSLDRPPRFGEPTGDLRMFDGLGQLRPVDMIPSGTSPPGPVRDCGYPVHAMRTATVPLDDRAPPGDQAIRVGYYTGVAAAATVAVGDGPGQHIAFQVGVHYVYVRVDGPVDSVDLRLDDTEVGAGVCVTDVVIGQPWPRPG